MRKGYWRTLTRRLRDKVAAGESAFVSSGEIISITRVEADPDADIAMEQEVPLARDEHGNALILHPANSAVILMQPDGEKRILATDLMAFIEGLRALTLPPPSQSGLLLGDVIEEPQDFLKPRRGAISD